jgi:hypothetical protein
MSNSPIKRENWKGRYVWVVRNKGKIVTWRLAKGTKASKQQLTKRFKEQRSLRKDVKRVKISKFSEIELTIKPNPRVPRRLQQFVMVVDWYRDTGKKQFVGTTTGYSRFIANQPLIEARNQAFTMAQGEAFTQFGLSYSTNFTIRKEYFQTFKTTWQGEKEAATT